MIWMNTIEQGRFEDTNQMFENPDNATYTVKGFQSDEEIQNFAKQLGSAYGI